MTIHTLARIARVPFVHCVVNGDAMRARVYLFGVPVASLAI